MRPSIQDNSQGYAALSSNAASSERRPQTVISLLDMHAATGVAVRLTILLLVGISVDEIYNWPLREALSFA
jgi:hypothetical protein